MSNEASVPGTPKPLVLFVDDMPDLRQLVEIGMRRYSPPFDAAFAEDVESALRVVRERRPVAVVLDVNLPGETGMDIAEYLHQYEPQMLKAVLTAYDRTMTHANADRFDMDVWPKPITIMELFEKVGALLEQRPAAPGGAAAAAPRVFKVVAAVLGFFGSAHVPRWH